MFFADTTGRASVHRASCSGASGSEIMFTVTAPADGKMSASLMSFGAELTVSVRTACDDDTSEIACSNAFPGPSVTVPVTAGTMYVVMVDGNTPADFGQFTLDLEIVEPESICDDFLDNDGDGYLDCDDPTNCQMLPACAPAPGAKPAGHPCVEPSDCQANQNDPICLGATQGLPTSYCSQFCTTAPDDCGPNAVCYTGFNLSVHGVCLQACTQDNQCAVSLGCVDLGLASHVCMTPPETICDDLIDNDNDGLIDCQDPTDCQMLPACVPGTKTPGEPCTANTDCAANHNDPICLTQGFPGGYCSEFCNVMPDDCGANAICAPMGPNATNVCMQTCMTGSDCQIGYSCVDLGFAEKICF
jgi:hypothetical protein